jgi:hypothetical protein
VTGAAFAIAYEAGLRAAHAAGCEQARRRVRVAAESVRILREEHEK